MWALESLGLDETADERAVKRAYAARLKSARPDEDPQGFQKLHETYQAALAYLRGGEELDGNTTETAPDPVKRFSLDLSAFSNKMLSFASANGPASLRDWLATSMQGWPLAIRPLVAPHLLDLLIENERGVSMAHFEVIADAFGFDDVLGTVDPLRLRQLRSRLESVARMRKRDRYAMKVRALLEEDERAGLPDDASPAQANSTVWLAERPELFARLLAPRNRRVLWKHLSANANARYSYAATRRYAYLLTSRWSLAYAYILRRIPFVTLAVERFIDCIDDGRSDALSVAIGERTLRLWNYDSIKLNTMMAEISKATRLIFLLFLVVFVFASEFFYPLTPDDQETLAWRLEKEGERLANLNRHAEALSFYDRLM